MTVEDQVHDTGKVKLCGMTPMKPDSGVVTDARVTPPDKLGLYYAGVPATFSLPPTDAQRTLRGCGPVQEYEANPLLKLMMQNAAAAEAAQPVPTIADEIAFERQIIEAGKRSIAALQETVDRAERRLAQLEGIAPLTTVKEPMPVRALRSQVPETDPCVER